MKQILQNRKTGSIDIVDVPQPARTAGNLLVRVHASVISAGTEGSMVAATGRSLLQRIADKPDLIRKGVETLRTQGVSGLKNQIENKYAGYELLGYSCAGRVLESDPAAEGIAPGTRVACGGIGYACHAEVVSVPHRLCVVVPDAVSDETAAYATIGAIAMQGVRQAGVALGENVAVIGLGLVGLLAAQLLRAAGCTVIGIDPSKSARERGLSSGCSSVASLEEAVEITRQASRGIGADAVLICAATSSSDPIALAGELARSRGRVVMVGATGMEIPRELYFRKELSFALSRSYGPGRYDPTYEEGGLDYPVDYVRFTEQRNMQAFLDLAAAGAVSVERISTHRFAMADAGDAYALLSDASTDRVGIVLEYPHASELAPRPTVSATQSAAGKTGQGISFIGAGGYAEGVLLPAIRKVDGVTLRGVCARQPAKASSTASRFHFAFATAQAEEVLNDDATGAVFIATRHDSHAQYTAAALRAGKHVWVEKPLALTATELDEIVSLHREAGTVLAVGFNRRFSPLSKSLMSKLPSGSPVMATYRVNAGHLPPEHWTQDPKAGGGRLLGEGCHFLDYLCFVAQSRPVTVYATALRSERGDLPAESNFAVTVSFENGSVGQLLYAAEGSPALPKERVEVYAGGTAFVLDDFKSLAVHGRETKTENLKIQDKGQNNMVRAFVEAVHGNAPFPVAADAFFTSSRLTLAARESLLSGKALEL